MEIAAIGSVRSWRGVGCAWIAGCALGADVHATVYSVGPATDSACQYHDLQTAVTAAANHAGADVIQVSRGSYVAQAINVQDDDDLTISGGTTSCADIAHSGITILSGAGAVPSGQSVVNWGGAGNLTLAHLTITAGSSDFFGGGIDGGGFGALHLQDIDLDANNASDGGGLFVEGGPDAHMMVTLDGVRFDGNSARSGGGIYAVDANIAISGDGSSYFRNNAATGGQSGSGNGGGLFLRNSNVVATTHSAGGIDFLEGNSAAVEGGAIYSSVSEAGAFEVLLANDAATNPLVVSNNSAQAQGGAFYFESISTGQQILFVGDFSNLIIEHNAADDGAAITTFASAAGSADATTAIQLQQSDTTASPACVASLECNAIVDNRIDGGAVFSMAAEGAHAFTPFSLQRGYLRNNSAAFLINGIAAAIDIDGSLVAGNTVVELIDNDTADTRIANSTIAGNSVSGPELILIERENGLPIGTLELLHDLIFQPDSTLFQVASDVPVNTRDLLLGNDTGVSGKNIRLTTDPGFVDSQQGDFHLAAGSPGIDGWADAGDPNDPPPLLDLDRVARPQIVSSAAAPYDFGAYEFNGASDRIFANGFD